MSEGGGGPIFVVGCARAGTTLLQQILNAHPDVAITPETHFVPRFWLRAGDYGDLQSGDGFQRLLDDIAADEAFQALRIPPRRFLEATAAGPRDFGSVLRTIMQLVAEHKGARILGEKTPLHLRHMRRLAAAFPGARFVHLVRDPRAVVASRRTQPWAPESVARNALYWRNTMRAARKQQRALGPSVITLRYEDLVRSPEATIRSLCAALALPFHPAMLEHWKHHREFVDVAREPWKAAALEPITPDAADRWRSRLSPGDVETVEAVAWREMRAAGYRPVTPLPRLVLRAAAAGVGRGVGALRRRLLKDGVDRPAATS